MGKAKRVRLCKKENRSVVKFEIDLGEGIKLTLRRDKNNDGWIEVQQESHTWDTPTWRFRRLVDAYLMNELAKGAHRLSDVLHFSDNPVDEDFSE